jgi:hypothetical protein
MPTIHSKVFDKYTMDVYRYFDTERDANGDYKHCTQVYSGVPCNRHFTNNYDNEAGVGNYKKNNIRTSDKVTFDNNYDIEPEDYIYFADLNSWYRVMGESKRRDLLGRSKVYLNLAPTPGTFVAAPPPGGTP